MWTNLRTRAFVHSYKPYLRLPRIRRSHMDVLGSVTCRPDRTSSSGGLTHPAFIPLCDQFIPHRHDQLWETFGVFCITLSWRLSHGNTPAWYCVRDKTYVFSIRSLFVLGFATMPRALLKLRCIHRAICCLETYTRRHCVSWSFFLNEWFGTFQEGPHPALSLPGREDCCGFRQGRGGVPREQRSM